VSSLSQPQKAAAETFVNVAIEALKTDRGVHAETAVASLARMAGTFMFRSFALPLSDVAPGQIVLSDAANENGPRLVQALIATLAHFGFNLDRATLDASVASPASAPLLGFLDTQRKLEPTFVAIKNRLGLSYQEAADSAAVATALLICQSASVLEPHTAFWHRCICLR
jgi:hypothetical protein